MRILAISDIHGKVGAVRRLMRIERGTLDAVIIAGDVGGYIDGDLRRPAREVMAILADLRCPILYIYGNWDHVEPYGRRYGPLCHHLHLRPYRLADLTFVGFSGCPTHWGRNPIANKRSDWKEIVRLNTEAMAAKILDPFRTIVVTHEKLSHAVNRLPGVPLFLNGHIHRFDDRTFRGARFINVAALDRPVPYLREGHLWSLENIRNFNTGTYCILEVGDHGMQVECKRLYPDPILPGWQRLELEQWPQARWIHDE